MSKTAPNNAFLAAISFITKDIIGDILYFPLWWYSQGLKKTALGFWEQLKSMARGLALPVLARHLLKPMYGDYTRSGRVISFFMRIIQFAVLSVGVSIWALILLVLLIAWIAAPALIVYMLIRQIF